MISGTGPSGGDASRELPRGPHSLSRKQVVSNQRERIVAAMIDAVGELGYTQTTVADVIARAGVSRKAFYEHFDNKEACFLETYDEIVAQGIDRVASAYRSAESVPQAAVSGIEALFEQALKRPHAVRLVLVEIGAVGSAGTDRRERLTVAYEQMLRESLGLPRGAGMIPNPILRALVGGLNYVLYTRVQSGRQTQLRTLVPELMSWITSYYPVPDTMTNLEDPPPHRASARLVGGRAPGTLAPAMSSGKRRGLRGEHAGSHSYVVHSQRERVLDAVARLSAAKGYTALTVKEIAEEAAISLDAFYEHFLDKEDAFLVAYEVGHSKGLAFVGRAYKAAEDWRTGVHAAIAALFDFLASEPAFAHLALVDALVATSRTSQRARKGISAYAQMLLPGFEETTDRLKAPTVTVEAIAGGIFELCFSYTLHERAEDLSELLPRATYFALAPFIGAEAAGLAAIEHSSN